jgi:hypothetical protein
MHDPEAQRWWRIRDRAGVVMCETSPDGLAWESLHDETSPGTTTDLVILFAVGSANQVSDVVEVDNLNLPPGLSIPTPELE